MYKFILKINTPAEPLPQADNIACYAASTELPLARLAELNGLDKMLLLFGEGAAEVCRSLGADGLLAAPDPALPLKAQVKSWQNQSGPRAVLGLIVPPRRHEAMLASETEPAFVAFRLDPAEWESQLEVLKWYNELFLIQSALDLSGFDPADAQKIAAAASADFVIINSADYADFSC